MFRRSILLLATLLLGTAAASAQPRYVASPPLATSLGKTPVQGVRAGPVQVPIITWGGDIATIRANGDQAATAAGSAFAQEGLDLRLVREDVFSRQIEAYRAGRSPYLRGTLGMVNMAADLLGADPRTKPVVIYQMTWSAGGDALVVKPGIGSAKDLKGKTVALQAYGPHVDYLTKILDDAGLSIRDVTVKWLPDLTGTGNSPMAALQQGDVDAAFVITPDAMVLTSGGAVGTGAEDSVRGAKILLSTKTANRIIADVYAVRSDYLQAHRKDVQAFVHGLMVGEEQLRALVKGKAAKGAAYRKTMVAAATLLLDSPQAVADAEGLYADAEFVGYAGNVDFFANAKYPRSLAALNAEIQSGFAPTGLVRGNARLDGADWDYGALKRGLTATVAAESPRFDEGQVAAVISKRQQQNRMTEGQLFAFEIFFEPNQNAFTADLYRESFDKVIDLSSTYGGALITIEGHSDPMAYLRGKKAGESELVLGRIRQSAKNLSLSRAIAVRDSLIEYARGKGITLDESQFAVVGQGIAQPRSGLCGADPCAPKDEREWRNNMRVQFRLLQVEAEAEVFKPL
jgi:ABC-type nitrate/sulfonate/bicarbonate transport system substrate-binding protein